MNMAFMEFSKDDVESKDVDSKADPGESEGNILGQMSGAGVDG